MRGWKRNARRRTASSELLHDLEDAALRRVLAAKRVASPYTSALQRLAVPCRDIVDVGVRPALLRADEPGQLVFQMIRDQPSDQVALGERAWTVHHARVHAHQRAAAVNRFGGDAIGGDFRALIIVGEERLRSIARRQRDERRSVQHARSAERRGSGQHVSKTPDVDVVEVFRPAPPDADERGGMRNRVAASCGELDCRAIANVAVDGRAGKTAAAGVAREDDQLVPSRGQRPDDGAAEIPGAARHHHFHGVLVRQYSRRSSSVFSIGISGRQPSSSRRRVGSPSRSGVSFGR